MTLDEEQAEFARLMVAEWEEARDNLSREIHARMFAPGFPTTYVPPTDAELAASRAAREKERSDTIDGWFAEWSCYAVTREDCEWAYDCDGRGGDGWDSSDDEYLCKHFRDHRRHVLGLPKIWEP